jgi:hypothetical protein
MRNVLSEERKQQVIALGRLGWTLRRIQRVTGVRRETAGAYLKAAGIPLRPAGKTGSDPILPAVLRAKTSAGCGVAPGHGVPRVRGISGFCRVLL